MTLRLVRFRRFGSRCEKSENTVDERRRRKKSARACIGVRDSPKVSHFNHFPLAPSSSLSLSFYPPSTQ